MAKNYNSQTGNLYNNNKDIPKMPEGYYSGGKPNPNLRAFVEQHIKDRPYDLMDDDYACKPLLVSSKVKRSTKIFNMHTYWSKSLMKA